jgi:hypothetical protein
MGEFMRVTWRKCLTVCLVLLGLIALGLNNSSRLTASVVNECGGVEYDPATQGCCGGVVYDLSSQSCCGSQVIDLATQACCNGTPYDISSQGCCNGEQVYDLSSEGCCCLDGPCTVYQLDSECCCECE